jgi:hypothetical protein
MEINLAIVPAFPLVMLVLGAVGFRLGAIVYNANKPIEGTKPSNPEASDKDTSV